MARLNVAIKKAEVSQFYKVLILLVRIFFIPVLLISIFCSFCFLSSKLVGDVPTMFGISVITLKNDVGDFKKGELVSIERTDLSQINVGDYVAYFEPTAEENEKGSQVLFNKVAEIAINPENNEQIVAFEGESYYIVKEAVIGKYTEKSNFVKNSITFFASRYTLVFLDLLPLSLLLLAVIMYLIEIKNVERINNELVASQVIVNEQKENVENDKINNVKKPQVVDDKTLKQIEKGENKQQTVQNNDDVKVQIKNKEQKDLSNKPLPQKPEQKIIQKDSSNNADIKSIPPKPPTKPLAQTVAKPAEQNASKSTDKQTKPLAKSEVKSQQKQNSMPTKSESKPPVKPEVKIPAKPQGKPPVKPEASVPAKPPIKPPVKPVSKPPIKPKTNSTGKQNNVTANLPPKPSDNQDKKN